MAATVGSRPIDNSRDRTLGHRLVVSALRSLIVVLGILASAAPKHR
jgi:hypothetical protein